MNPSGSLERFSLLREIALGRWKLRVQFIVMDIREIKIIPLGNDRLVNEVLTCNQSIVHSRRWMFNLYSCDISSYVPLTLFSNYSQKKPTWSCYHLLCSLNIQKLFSIKTQLQAF